MDIFSLLMQIAIFIVFITAYFVIFGEKSKKKNNHYSLPGWNHFLKKWCAKCVVNKWKDSNEPLVIAEKTEEPRYFTQEESWDSHSFFGVDSNGTHFQVAIKVRKHGVAETILKLQMEDGTVYQMPGYPDTVVGRISKKSWNAGGLRFTLVEPFKKWRVTFNGFLEKYSRHDASQEAKEVIHVRFSLIWVTCSPPFRFPEDWSTEMIIESMACEPWTNQDWVNMSHQWEYGNYYQYGSLQGEMYVGQDLKPVLLRLRGVRDHSWAPYGCKPLNRTLHLFGTSSDGYLYNINVISFISGLTHAISGSIRCPNGVIESLTSCDLNLSDFAEVETEIPKSFSFVFTGIRSYKLILDMNINRQSKFMSGQPWNFVTRSVPTEFVLNGSHGYGFINLQYPYNGKSSAKVSLTNILEWYPLNRADAGFTCANFNETTACCPELVGVKGASLSLLSSVKSEDYKVPPGFCLTTKAFDDHLSANPELSKIIAEIHELNENYNEAKLKEQCYKATQLFNGTSVTGNIASMIKIYLDELQALVFSSNIVFDITYAVRSSGIGEDSEELSAAGQNETILGCRDITDILKGIQRCWGSLFSYHSVQYRRLHGQPVNCGMGVVVQVIIPAQAAGVMFTRHPNNGDPSTILITSNYGLGESVVSGQIEPDTILLNRDIDNRLSVREIIIGKKTHRINVNKEESADQLTESVALTAEEIASSSISEAISLRLGSIAVNQERLWGAPRDIEWALHNDTIYLVQARPITTLNPWTEYELLHEFDSPIMSDEDILSFANTGEVLPGYLSPLTISTVCSTLQNGVKILSGRSPSDGYNTQEMFTISHCRFGLNMYNSVYLKVPEKIDISVRVMEIGVCGHPVIDDRIHSTALRRNRPTTMDRIVNLFIFIKAIFGSGAALEKAEVISKNFDLGEEAYESATDLLTALEESVEKLTQVVIYHNATTSASLFGQIIAMSILVENNKDLTIEHYTDIGRMLSSCSNVISAEVPIGLAEIVDTILNADNADAFCEQTPENGLAWLETNNKKAFNKLTTFLLKHRHRNIKEFDLATKTWGLDPSILIKSLQSVVAAGAPTKKREKTETSSAAVVAKLESPKKGITRFLLRLILPLCQKSVAHREGTKDQTILAIHKIRLAFLRLGKLMVRDWMLPDIDLVFFFTMYELRTYLKTRNSSFLNKAVQRRKFYPKWNALQFPETNEGYLEPLKKDDSRVTYHPSGNSMRIVGTPVTAGSIVGRACVVHNLSEIDQLKGGDILITHSTDIGWSPYFPLLGGVVTELGGLISHGAVIAREYGLPCIVGAQGAMSFFKTGDIILLAGTTGILEKVDPVEPKVVESNV